MEISVISKKDEDPSDNNCKKINSIQIPSGIVDLDSIREDIFKFINDSVCFIVTGNNPKETVCVQIKVPDESNDYDLIGLISAMMRFFHNRGISSSLIPEESKNTVLQMLKTNYDDIQNNGTLQQNI